MYGRGIQEQIRQALEEAERAGLTRRERILDGAQGVEIVLADGRRVINLCANNYLGLSGDADVVEAARRGLERWGYGMSSVRFICGTQTIHTQLESAISGFLGCEDTLLYSSCFDANGGLFEALLGEADAVISDELNHASIIDGIRLCKARRLRYAHNDLKDLEARLIEARTARFRMIATDGVFSMEGAIAQLGGICDLAERHDALVMVDDSHGVGVIGPTGRGTPEYCRCAGRVDLITGTLGKALGGASGGYTSGRRDLIALLRQRSRPYLFSNSLAPPIVAASLAVLDRLASGTEWLDRLHENTRYFRSGMAAAGFEIPGGEHPLVPIFLGDAGRAQTMAARMLDRGVYVVGFSYPVVPKDRARIRVQISAAHTKEHLDRAMTAFRETRKEIGV